MSVRRVVPNITCDGAEESRKFYTDFLGFGVAMDMGWIVTLASPGNPTAQVSLFQKPAQGPTQPLMSLTIEVDDVDAVHAKAAACGIQIIYPLTDEPWGVRRFHVADPSGVIINVMSHHK